MNQTKKLLFVGNRAGVYKEIQNLPGLEIVAVLALTNSYLHAELVNDRRNSVVFLTSEKDLVVSTIANTEFDILV